MWISPGPEAPRNEMSCGSLTVSDVTVAQPDLSVCPLSLGHGYSRKERSSNRDPENSSGFGQVRLGWEKCLGKRRDPGRCPANTSLRKLGLLNHRPSSFPRPQEFGVLLSVSGGITCTQATQLLFQSQSRSLLFLKIVLLDTWWGPASGLQRC